MVRTVGVTVDAYVLSIRLSGGSPSETTFVRAVNRRTREFFEVTVNNNDATINLSNLSSDGTKNGTFSGFNNNDEIEVRCHGNRIGTATHTVTKAAGKGRLTVTIIDVTATTNPSVTI